jgi:hypothetical protein
LVSPRSKETAHCVFTGGINHKANPARRHENKKNAFIVGGRFAFATALGMTDTPDRWSTNKRGVVNPLRPVIRGVIAHSGMIDMPAHTRVLKALRSDTPTAFWFLALRSPV